MRLINNSITRNLYESLQEESVMINTGSTTITSDETGVEIEDNGNTITTGNGVTVTVDNEADVLGVPTEDMGDTMIPDMPEDSIDTEEVPEETDEIESEEESEEEFDDDLEESTVNEEVLEKKDEETEEELNNSKTDPVLKLSDTYREIKVPKGHITATPSIAREINSKKEDKEVMGEADGYNQNQNVEIYQNPEFDYKISDITELENTDQGDVRAIDMFNILNDLEESLVERYGTENWGLLNPFVTRAGKHHKTNESYGSAITDVGIPAGNGKKALNTVLTFEIFGDSLIKECVVRSTRDNKKIDRFCGKTVNPVKFLESVIVDLINNRPDDINSYSMNESEEEDNKYWELVDKYEKGDLSKEDLKAELTKLHPNDTEAVEADYDSIIGKDKDRNLNEEISHEAYMVAEAIAKQFEGQDLILWDDFSEAMEHYAREIDPELISDEKLYDFEQDVRSIMSQYYGWATIYEGENEGGLTTKEITNEAAELYSTIYYLAGDESEEEAANYVNRLKKDFPNANVQFRSIKSDGIPAVEIIGTRDDVVNFCYDFEPLNPKELGMSDEEFNKMITPYNGDMLESVEVMVNEPMKDKGVNFADSKAIDKDEKRQENHLKQHKDDFKEKKFKVENEPDQNNTTGEKEEDLTDTEKVDKLPKAKKVKVDAEKLKVKKPKKLKEAEEELLDEPIVDETNVKDDELVDIDDELEEGATETAIFHRKPASVDAMRALEQNGVTVNKSNYKIIGTHELPYKEFNDFANHLSSGHYDWLKTEYGDNQSNSGMFNCIEVINTDDDSYSILVDPNGYDYAKFAAIKENVKEDELLDEPEEAEEEITD